MSAGRRIPMVSCTRPKGRQEEILSFFGMETDWQYLDALAAATPAVVRAAMRNATRGLEAKR